MKKIIFSIKDFVRMNDLLQVELWKKEQPKINYDNQEFGKIEKPEQTKKRLANDRDYQELLALSNRLNEVSIEIETPEIEVKERK